LYRKPDVEIEKSKLPKLYPVNKVIQFGPVEENVQKEFIKVNISKKKKKKTYYYYFYNDYKIY